MPHLSPMNWILMLLSMFTLLLMLNSNLWWKPKSSFSLPINKHTKINQIWLW